MVTSVSSDSSSGLVTNEDATSTPQSLSQQNTMPSSNKDSTDSNPLENSTLSESFREEQQIITPQPPSSSPKFPRMKRRFRHSNNQIEQLQMENSRLEQQIEMITSKMTELLVNMDESENL